MIQQHILILEKKELNALMKSLTGRDDGKLVSVFGGVDDDANPKLEVRFSMPDTGSILKP